MQEKRNLLITISIPFSFCCTNAHYEIMGIWVGVLWKALSLRETYNNTTKNQSPCFLNSRHTTMEHANADPASIESTTNDSFDEM